MTAGRDEERDLAQLQQFLLYPGSGLTAAGDAVSEIRGATFAGWPQPTGPSMR